MSDATPPPAGHAARELYDECLARGFVSGVDFFIEGSHAPLSSELIVLVKAPSGWQALSSDMGRESVIAEGATIESVRDVFLEEVAWLAAGRRRGPYAGRSRSETVPPLSYDEAVAAFERDFGPGTV